MKISRIPTLFGSTYLFFYLLMNTVQAQTETFDPENLVKEGIQLIQDPLCDPTTLNQVYNFLFVVVEGNEKMNALWVAGNSLDPRIVVAPVKSPKILSEIFQKYRESIRRALMSRIAWRDGKSNVEKQSARIQSVLKVRAIDLFSHIGFFSDALFLEKQFHFEKDSETKKIIVDTYALLASVEPLQSSRLKNLNTLLKFVNDFQTEEQPFSMVKMVENPLYHPSTISQIGAIGLMAFPVAESLPAIQRVITEVSSPHIRFAAYYGFQRIIRTRQSRSRITLSDLRWFQERLLQDEKIELLDPFADSFTEVLRNQISNQIKSSLSRVDISAYPDKIDWILEQVIPGKDYEPIDQKVILSNLGTFIENSQNRTFPRLKKGLELALTGELSPEIATNIKKILKTLN